ncbi:MAG TPA: glutamate-5-semialdehyde dehydrogenase [Polyangia bacterium]|jgi:gamma-glutamyl phosphate reductase|nr:glutamate-5-semialdehyde dehydrogenase [Polyangia bacterium]
MDLRESLIAARAAARRLAGLTGPERSHLLADFAAALARPDARTAVLEANARDMASARVEEAAGRLGSSLVKRLLLDDKKLDTTIDGIRQLADMPELVGRTLTHRALDHGLILKRVSCPLGVLGVVFEARPDALVQITSLAWKSGNAVALKGGREASESNRALCAVAHDVLSAHGIDTRAMVLLEDRAEVDALLTMDDLVELAIARGSSSFIQHVRSHTRIPVMAHADGICHMYLHAAADPAMAARLVVDAKCSYPAACNAVETLLWDPEATAALDSCLAALSAEGVELRGCKETRKLHPQMNAATGADWDAEYGALILSIRQVAGMDQALAHIARHGSRHTDVIVTQDQVAAARFLAEVDAACVFHNASNRFSDGYRFGLGAEVGISTEKLHARGPVGVEGLLTYRWLLYGHGQATTEYGPGGRHYTHKDLPVDG